jgi:hypothetical protein
VLSSLFVRLTDRWLTRRDAVGRRQRRRRSLLIAAPVPVPLLVRQERRRWTSL